MFKQFEIITELFSDSLHKHFFTRRTRSWFVKFSIERTFNFIIFRALLSNEFYFNIWLLLYADFKGTLMKFGNLPLCSCSYKNETLKILFSES